MNSRLIAFAAVALSSPIALAAQGNCKNVPTSVNVTISYNFMDYWDIPADEVALNPPAAGSAAVLNPNY